jgi:hypothetical protein
VLRYHVHQFENDCMASTHKIEYEYISYTNLSLNPAYDVQSSCITIMDELVTRRRPMQSAQYVFLDNSQLVGKDWPFLDHMQDSARTTNRARLAASHGQGCKRGPARHTLHRTARALVLSRYAMSCRRFVPSSMKPRMELPMLRCDSQVVP